MEVLLINVHSFHNAGDFSLTLVSLQQLHRCFPGCRITLAMNDPDSYRRKRDDPRESVVESFFAWSRETGGASGYRRYLKLANVMWSIGLSVVVAVWYRLTGRRMLSLLPVRHRRGVEAYLKADIVVSCAGNFLYSRGHLRGVPILGPAFTIAFGQLCGKPVYMLPQTIGPIWRGWELRLLNRLLRRFRLLLLRDPTSVDLVQTLHIGATPYRLTPDLAFLFRGASAAVGQATLHAHGIDFERPLLGVTLINWGAQHPIFKRQDRYERAVAAAIRHFIETYGGQAVLFAQVCGPTPADDDRIPARRVHAMLGAQYLAKHVHIIDDELAPGILQAAYGCTDLFLGSRLHSNIFALTRHIPVLAIAYQSKTVGVMRELDLEDWTMRIEDVEDAPLIALLDQLWQERAQVKKQVIAGVERLQQQAEGGVDRLAADYAAMRRHAP